MTDRFDVLVAGAGPSGLLAAIAAAREGASVRLIEKSMHLGGMNTAAMVGPLMGFHAGDTQVVRGLAQQVVDRLLAQQGSLGHLPDPLGVASTITPIEPTVLKQVYFQMLRQYPGLSLQLGTRVCGVRREGARLLSVETCAKDGIRQQEADVFIDATGDGDLAALSGVPFTLGRPLDGLSQPMTLVFKIGGVNFDAVRAYVRKNPGQFVLGAQGPDMPYVAISGFFDLVAQGHADGALTLPRDRVLLFQGVRAGEAIVNMTRILGKDGTTAAGLTDAETEGRAQLDEALRFLIQSVPGFSGAYLAESGDCIGVRESRHIHGRYTLTVDDIRTGAAFPDSIAMCAFPIDLHDPSGKGLHWQQEDAIQPYDIPYRVMLPESANHLLVTGRCASATHEAAASMRITPTAMAMGEAAGIAAAMAARAGIPVAAVDVPALQASILRHGGVPGRTYLR